MLDKILNLKKYNIIGLKSEFEAEGASFDEVMELRELTRCAGLRLTLKLGGAEAVRDMLDAKRIQPDTIVAPMIESGYALKKFVQTAGSILDKVDLYINIETKCGYENLDEIISTPEFERVDGVVLGRSDMAQSYGGIDVNSNQMFSIAEDIKQKCANKIYVIGGSVAPDSLEIFKKINPTAVETRKVIFESLTEDGIQKALEFEKFWLEKYCKTKRDIERIEELNRRLCTI